MIPDLPPTPLTIGASNSVVMVGLSHRQCLRIAERHGCRVYRVGRRRLIDGGDLLRAIQLETEQAEREQHSEPSEADVAESFRCELGLERRAS